MNSYLMRSGKMVRKYFRKSPSLSTLLNKNQMLILFYIASLEEWQIITQTNVAKNFNKPITTLNYHFTKLRKGGLIKKNNHLTDKGKKVLRYLKHWDKTFNKRLRAHKIQIIFYLARCPENLEKIKNFVFTPFTNNRYRGLKCELKGCTIMFYGKKKAVVIIPDIYGNNDEEISATITEFISQLIKVLEEEFKGLKVDHYKPARFTSMHVAILDSVIAESFLLNKKHCYTNGRVAIDCSHGRYELESEKGETALEDIEVLVNYEDLARENLKLKKMVEEIQSPVKKTRKKEEKAIQKAPHSN